MSIQGSINQAIAVTSAVSTQMKKKADLDVAEHRAIMALHRAKRAQKAAADIEARVDQKIKAWEQTHGKE